MDGIIKIDNFYFTSKFEETDPKKCSQNLINRMKLIDNTNFNKVSYCEIDDKFYKLDENKGIINFKEIPEYLSTRINRRCICGHKINNCFFVTNGINTAIIGCECIKKFNPDLYKKTKKLHNELKKTDCNICNCNVQYKHFKSKTHLNKLSKKLSELRTKKILQIQNKNYISQIISQMLIFNKEKKIRKLKFLEEHLIHKLKIKNEEEYLLKNFNKCTTCEHFIEKKPFITQCLDCWKLKNKVKSNKIYKTPQNIRDAVKRYYIRKQSVYF